MVNIFKKLTQSFFKKLESLKTCECQRKMVAAHLRYFKQLYKIRLVENALNVGDKVPDFTVLQDASGQTVNVYERLKQGPLVIKFFRGTWCMFCSADLQFLNENYDELTKQGASAIAISTMPLEASKKAAEEHDIKYSLISDTQLEIARKFGLVIRLSDELIELYKEHYNVDLVRFLGKKDVDLILPSTYVINQQGVIVYAYIEEDFRNRADIAEVLRVVRKAKIDQQKYAKKCFDEECRIEAFMKAVVQGVHRKSSSFFKKPKTSSHPDLLRPSSSTDISEKDPFMFTLHNEDYLESFKSYLNKTYCAENLLFYFDAADFRNSFDEKKGDEAKEHATRLFETFVKIGSDLEVNIDDDTRERIVADIKEGKITQDMFVTAAKEVYVLMESDSFVKWRKTKDYSEVWKKSGSMEFMAPTPGFAEAA